MSCKHNFLPFTDTHSLYVFNTDDKVSRRYFIPSKNILFFFLANYHKASPLCSSQDTSLKMWVFLTQLQCYYPNSHFLINFPESPQSIFLFYISPGLFPFGCNEYSQNIWQLCVPLCLFPWGKWVPENLTLQICLFASVGPPFPPVHSVSGTWHHRLD